MTEPRTVPLDDLRAARMERISALADLPAALLLLAAGLGGVGAGGGAAGTLWSATQALAGAALLGAVAREGLRARRAASAGDGEEEGIGWVEVAAAAMLTVEGIDGLRAANEAVSPAAVAGSAALVTAAFTLLKGLLSGRLRRRRRERRFVRVDADGLAFRGSRLRGWSLPWTAVARIEVDDREARVVAADGRVRRIPLRRYRNAAEAAALLRDAARRLETGGSPSVPAASGPADGDSGR